MEYLDLSDISSGLTVKNYIYLHWDASVVSVLLSYFHVLE